MVKPTGKTPVILNREDALKLLKTQYPIRQSERMIKELETRPPAISFHVDNNSTIELFTHEDSMKREAVRMFVTLNRCRETLGAIKGKARDINVMRAMADIDSVLQKVSYREGVLE